MAGDTRVVVSVSFNRGEWKRLVALRGGAALRGGDEAKLSTWIKQRLFASGVPVVTFQSGTTAGSSFRITDSSGKVLAEFRLGGSDEERWEGPEPPLPSHELVQKMEVDRND